MTEFFSNLESKIITAVRQQDSVAFTEAFSEARNSLYFFRKAWELAGDTDAGRAQFRHEMGSVFALAAKEPEAAEKLLKAAFSYRPEDEFTLFVARSMGDSAIQAFIKLLLPFPKIMIPYFPVLETICSEYGYQPHIISGLLDAFYASPQDLRDQLLLTLSKIQPQEFYTASFTNNGYRNLVGFAIERYLLNQGSAEIMKQVKPRFLLLARTYPVAAAFSVWQHLFLASTPADCERALPFAVELKGEMLELCCQLPIDNVNYSGDFHIAAQKFVINHLLDELVRRRCVDVIAHFFEQAGYIVKRSFEGSKEEYVTTFVKALAVCSDGDFGHMQLLRAYLNLVTNGYVEIPEVSGDVSEDIRPLFIILEALSKSDYETLAKIGAHDLGVSMRRIAGIVSKSGTDREKAESTLAGLYLEAARKAGAQELAMIEHPDKMARFRKPVGRSGAHQRLRRAFA